MPHQWGLNLGTFLYHFVLWHKTSYNTWKVVKQNLMKYLPTFFLHHECHFIASCNKVWYRSFLTIFCKIAIKFIEQLLLKFNLVMYYSAMYTEECLEHFKDYNDIIRRSMFCLSSLLHPFRNHWWALQSDWLSAVSLLHESHHFLL